MARIFSIQFDYEGSVHTAMVSVRATPFFTEYSINMLDEELMLQLPGNKILSTEPNHLAFMNTSPKEVTPLMECILNAVSHHLQTTTV
ncbi:MAG TPA: hypothetical protein VGE66_00085 [Chitinophagaceae bacterium]